MNYLSNVILKMIILDTNVLVSALRSRTGWSRQLVARVLAGKINAGVSVPLFIEYEDVLKRAENLTAFGLTGGEIDEFLEGIRNVIVKCVEVMPSHTEFIAKNCAAPRTAGARESLSAKPAPCRRAAAR